MSNPNTIHRASLSGRPVCGQSGPVRLSMSGVIVTCAACADAERPLTREQVMAIYADMAAKRAARKAEAR